MNIPSENILDKAIDRFWETIPSIWNTIRSRVRSAAAQQFDITVEQFHILRHLRKGSHSVSELADIGRISRPAISQAVDVLVNKNLVLRQQSSEDRRYFQLELTTEGKALLDGLFGQTRKWMKTRFTALSADDLQMVMSGLEILMEAFCDQKDIK